MPLPGDNKAVLTTGWWHIAQFAVLCWKNRVRPAIFVWKVGAARLAASSGACSSCAIRMNSSLSQESGQASFALQQTP